MPPLCRSLIPSEGVFNIILFFLSQALALEPRLPVPSLTKHGLAADSKQRSSLATLSPTR